jgi:hypothetical protein
MRLLLPLKNSISSSTLPTGGFSFKPKASSSVCSGLQYTIPRMKQATNEVSEDLPLFVQEEKHVVEIF